jgi:hypothetical protein
MNSDKSSVKRKRQRDGGFEIDDLPYDVLLTIVEQLEGTDLANLVMTNKRWASVANQEEFWRMATEKEKRWKSVVDKARPQLSWKQIYTRLFCLENAICFHCFKRSRIDHICKEAIDFELSNPILPTPLCFFYPGLHGERPSRTTNRSIDVEGIRS